MLHDATCRESLEEALRNLDKNVLEEMRSVGVRSVGALAPRRPVLPDLSPRRVSYVSSESFEANKRGWAAATVPDIIVNIEGRKTR